MLKIINEYLPKKRFTMVAFMHHIGVDLPMTKASLEPEIDRLPVEFTDIRRRLLGSESAMLFAAVFIQPIDERIDTGLLKVKLAQVLPDLELIRYEVV